VAVRPRAVPVDTEALRPTLTFYESTAPPAWVQGNQLGAAIEPATRARPATCRREQWLPVLRRGRNVRAVQQPASVHVAVQLGAEESCGRRELSGYFILWIYPTDRQTCQNGDLCERAPGPSDPSNNAAVTRIRVGSRTAGGAGPAPFLVFAGRCAFLLSEARAGVGEEWVRRSACPRMPMNSARCSCTARAERLLVRPSQ